MKRNIMLIAALLTVCGAMAQEEAAPKPAGHWATSSTPALKISEHLFNNWSKSGNSTFDVTSTFFGNYKYSHPRYVWDNVVDLAYGYGWQDLDPEGVLFETRRKSNDKIDLTSAISWNVYNGWGANFTANLKTQFGNGYEYDGVGKEAEATKKLVSGFFSPAYLTTALSFERKMENWSVSLSFLTGKTTFVTNGDLIDSGYTYGVIQRDTNYLINHHHTYAYFGLGSYIKAQYLKKDILPNLDLYARLEIFYDYRKPGSMNWDDLEKTEYRGYEYGDAARMAELADMGWMRRRFFETDIDFEVKVDYRLSKHIAANFALDLKYDTDFNGFGKGGHWQLYQMAGLQVFFNWKTPTE